jgi:hypothetical protein
MQLPRRRRRSLLGRLRPADRRRFRRPPLDAPPIAPLATIEAHARAAITDAPAGQPVGRLVRARIGAAGLSVLLALVVPACRSRTPARSPDAWAESSARACRDGAACASGEYCSFPDGRCGHGGAGVCRPRPATCDGARTPVCACDARVYDDECRAHAAGADLAITGGCRAVVPDWIPCGPRYCDARDRYCEIYLSDVPELPTDHACRPLPPRCRAADGAQPGCDCFPPTTPCLSFCGPMITGGRPGFHLTCQGVKPPWMKHR